MNIETVSAHITPIGGNAFADLSFGSEEAARLLVESNKAIAEELARMETLAFKRLVSAMK